MNLSEVCQFIKGLDPVADFGDTVTRSDVINMKNFGHVTFVIYKGVGTTGTSTITVNACDDVTPSNRSAIPFRYRAITSGDTPGALTYVESTGFTTTAGSSQLYIVEVDAEKVLASGYGYCELTMTEVVNSPVLGGILAIGSELRYNQDIPPTAIV